MTTVDFYYSIGSRYSYLAATQIEALERETGCSVRWQPLNSRTLIARRGHDPFRGPPVSGQYDWEYRECDAKRWAAFYDVPFIEPRGRVEFDSELLALASIAAKRLGAVRQYSYSLFSAMFAESSILCIDRAECIRRAMQCSIPESDFEDELNSSNAVAKLSGTLNTARNIGVFGVPTFETEGKLFWGNDRLVLLRHHLLRRSSEQSGS
jgi:2-hydroxychromene-2-carboxylate isomerase